MAWCWSCCNELPALPTTFSSRISPTLSGYLSLGRASSLSVFSDLSVLSCEHPRWQVQLTYPPARGYTNPWATDDVYHAPVTCAPIVDDGKSLMLSNDEVTSEYKQALATMRSRGGQQRGANKADSSEDQGREQDATLWALLERCELLAHSLSPQGLANVWWALAVLKLPPASLCSSAPCAGGADAAAGRHAAQGSERSAGPGGARAGRAGQDHHTTAAAQEAGAALMMSLEQPSPAPAGALQAEAAVRQGHVVVSASLERALKSRVLAVCAGRHFKGQEVSIILWSLATLSVAVEPALLSSLLLQVPLCPPSPPVFAPSVRCCVCVRVLFALIDAGSGQGNHAQVLSAIGVQCPLGPRNPGSSSSPSPPSALASLPATCGPWCQHAVRSGAQSRRRRPAQAASSEQRACRPHARRATSYGFVYGCERRLGPDGATGRVLTPIRTRRRRRWWRACRRGRWHAWMLSLRRQSPTPCGPSRTSAEGRRRAPTCWRRC